MFLGVELKTLHLGIKFVEILSRLGNTSCVLVVELLSQDLFHFLRFLLEFLEILTDFFLEAFNVLRHLILHICECK